MKANNMVIAQSGGPSMVINGSLVGAVLAARDKKLTGAKIGKIYGAVHGIQGILKGEYLDLRKVSVKKLEAIAKTPSTYTPYPPGWRRSSTSHTRSAGRGIFA